MEESLLLKTPHHQPAAAGTVPHALPAQRGESKSAGQDAEGQDCWVQKTFYASGSKGDHSWDQACEPFDKEKRGGTRGHGSAGKVSQMSTETHPALAGSVTLTWPHPQAFH